MKYSHLTILFVGIFAIVFMVFHAIYTVPAESYQDGNRQYSVALAGACEAGMMEADISAENVFEKETTREKVLSAFYKSLACGLNKDNGLNDDTICENIPFVILVDNDGYYISYNIAFDEAMSRYYSGSTEIDPDFLNTTNGMTELNTWSEDVNGCMVRFYLNDHVKIIDVSDNTFDGTRAEAAAKYPGLTFLKTEDAFTEEKRYVIINALENKINYLLNTQNIGINSGSLGYEVTLPKSDGEYWSRVISNPCLISFIQGDTMQIGSNLLDVYAYAGSEKLKTRLYYSSGDTYYRFNGTVTPGMDSFGSMKSMAENGANPDESALSENN